MNDTADDLMREHFNQVSRTARSGRYGLICYTYNGGMPDEGYYSPSRMNIGDYVQSLAARQFLPSADVYVDRDQLGTYEGEPIDMIMNAWHRLWRKTLTFSEKITPLMVAVHLNNPEAATAETIDYFKRHEPIGCRDVRTLEFLSSKGIKAYFSACLTLTLGRTYRVSESQRTTDVYFVDYRLGACNQIDAALLPVLHASRRRRKCYYRTHDYPIGTDVEAGLREAEALVKEYARAGLVITRNIHCALPCLALGTPVIFVAPKFDSSRFIGLADFFNFVGVGEDGESVCRIDVDKQGHVRNPERHKPYADYLEKIASTFGVDAKFAGMGSSFLGASVPRVPYLDAEAETGLVRHLYQRRYCADGCVITLMGHFTFRWTSSSRVVRTYRAIKSLLGGRSR